MENDIDPETSKDLISEITAKGFTLVSLIDNILDLAKLDSKQLSVNYSDVSIIDIFNEIQFTFKENIENKGLKFIVKKSSEDNIIVYYDSYRLKQVLTYLLDNALKYTESGYIELGYEIQNTNKENRIKLYVKDTGIGISKDRLDLIFQRFTKIEDDRKKLYRGAGLGLTISKNIVKLFNGELNVKSELTNLPAGKAGGSLFYFSIPVKSIISNEKIYLSNSEEGNYQWNNKTILIAEDDESNFRFFKMILSKTQANILHARNGIEAIKICQEKVIDLVLMDIKMPEMDGLEATKIIKKDIGNITIIALTAFAMGNDEKMSLDAGCDAYLSKPVRKPDLLGMLNKFFS